jgi:GAF domain-containing protein
VIGPTDSHGRSGAGMEPIPETSEAVDEYGPFATDEGDLLDELRAKAERVRDLVPECIGISLASREHGVTFTLVASSEEIATLDALQYLAGGPCVEGAETERVLEYSQEELFAEASWQLFAQATAATSVASTLTLPIVVEGLAVGSVNLYAATPDAFTGQHEPLALIFDAWAPGAVVNADLGFSTREVAEQAPGILHEGVRINAALGVIMAFHEVDLETARKRLHAAARQAGTTAALVAEKLLSSAELGDHNIE